MPLLPALRCSPGRDYITENSFKRSPLEVGLTLKTKEDELVLFNEVKNRERDNFLLQTSDDFENSLSKLRRLSDCQLSVNIPARGETSDLLNVEGDKNDYDWLLTPPDTPLFPKLDDDDDNQPVNLARRGRTRSQPISISRSMSDKSYRTSRTSYSPQRLTPSPRSSCTIAHVKGRTSSATQYSPPSVIRSTTPTRNSYSSPNKPPTPTPRSSSPMPPRTSTSSSIHASYYGGRGASPVNATHGNSSSPKLQGKKQILAGYNSEESPNQRTSFSDPSTSHVRDSSPMSRNGRELSIKPGRKSMSPTSSRRIITSQSPENYNSLTFFDVDDEESLHSRSVGVSRSPPRKDGALANSKAMREMSIKHGRKSMTPTSSRRIITSQSPEKYNSMESFGVDDEESLHSRSVGVSRSPLRKDGALANNKAMPFSRKPYRTSSSNPAPKRSFDSALRLLDQRKTPQNMFRPLLSSVPATTFRPIISRNSSLTTSSNASSEQGIFSVAPDLDDSEIEQIDLPGRWDRIEDFDTSDEVFLFDKVDEIIGDASNDAFFEEHQSLDEDFTEILREKLDSKDIQNVIVNDAGTSTSTFELAYCADNQCIIGDYPINVACSKCGKKIDINETIEKQNFCKQCAEENNHCAAEIAVISVPFTENVPTQVDAAVDAVSQGKLIDRVPEFNDDDNEKVIICQREKNIELGTELCPITSFMQSLDENKSQPSDQHLDINKNINVDVPECTGISVLLLQGSASTKPILQGKNLSSTNILCSDQSYSRNTSDYLRKSIVADSVSTTSLDLGLSRQTEAYVQHQLSWTNDALGVKRDINSTVLSMTSDNASTKSFESSERRNEFEGIFSSSTECLEYRSSRDLEMVSEFHTDSLDRSSFSSTPSSRPIIPEECTSVHADNCIAVSTSESRDLNCQPNNYLPCSSTAEIMCAEECSTSTRTYDDFQNIGSNACYMERTNENSVRSEKVDDQIMVNHKCENVILDAATNRSIETVESQDVYCALDWKNECIPSHDSLSLEQLNEHSVSQTSEIDISLCSSEPIAEALENGESAIVVEGQKGLVSKNLTLDEATNTILLCSSIIHDLAYQAATIAIEKEREVLADHRTPPLPITIREKSIPGLRELSGKMSSKHVPRSQKFKRKKIEIQPNSSPLREMVNVNDVNAEEFTPPKEDFQRKFDSEKYQKLESKCNCSVM